MHQDGAWKSRSVRASSSSDSKSLRAGVAGPLNEPRRWQCCCLRRSCCGSLTKVIVNTGGFLVPGIRFKLSRPSPMCLPPSACKLFGRRFWLLPYPDQDRERSSVSWKTRSKSQRKTAEVKLSGSGLKNSFPSSINFLTGPPNAHI